MKRALDIAASVALGVGMAAILVASAVAVIGFVSVQRVAEKAL